MIVPGRLLAPWAIFLIYAGLSVAVLAPVFSVPVPCLGDTLNHLARIHILTSVGHSPDLQRFYENTWRLVPYLGMDVPVAVLAHFIGLYQAGRLFLAACVLMPVIAAATLHHALYRRVGLVPALAFLVCYNFSLAEGFLNYIFSACLAIMLFAGWVAARDWRRWPRTVLFSVAATLLYLSHVFAFFDYGLMLACYEAQRAFKRDGRRLAAVAADIALAGLQAVPAALIVLFLQVKITVGASNTVSYGSVLEQAAGLMTPFYFPGQVWLAGLFAMLPLCALLLAPMIVLATPVWAVLTALAALAAVAPHVLYNVWGADFRLPLVLCIVGIGAARPSVRMSRSLAFGIVACVSVLVLARSVDAALLMRRVGAQVAELQTTLQSLPMGQRLLVVDGDKAAPGRVAPAMITGHIAMLAVIERDAFVPYLFAGPTALQLRDSMQRSASPNGASLTQAQLDEGFRTPEPAGKLPPFGYGGQKYWLGWPAKFDYVLICHYGTRNVAPPPDLVLAAQGKVADLYRIAAK